MMKAKTISVAALVHIFGILHAALALSCRSLGLSDELALTILTITMAVVISLKKKVVVEFYALSIIIVNVVGYLLGMVFAQLLSKVIPSELAFHALSTFITTEILGWGLAWLSKFFKSEEDGNALKSLRFVLLAAVGIIIVRLLFLTMLSNLQPTSDQVLDVVHRAANNMVALVCMVCLDVLYVRYGMGLMKKWGLAFKGIMLVAFIGFGALAEALMIGGKDELSLTIVVSLIVHLCVFSVVYVIYYVRLSREEMLEARENANLAQYRYIKLKSQVNPHFLFNSLNVLDCLICEEKTAQASLYTHKLAGVYRYLIKSEDMDMVSLAEELEFVGQYVDLQKVRFPEGLNVEVSVEEGLMSKMLLPCAIQLLVENAIKHNAVLPQNPLTIKIIAKGESLRVENNIVPKVSPTPSTGLGHKYIRQQYLDLCGKEIQILEEEEYYAVVLPLI
ncbi:MAG: sensor histidine kinase [Candidatus Cryptobacteroides sp.]